MKYSLGQKSSSNLKGVHPDMVAIVQRAIEITEQDFAVHEGVRSPETQRIYLMKGVTKTLESRHLPGKDGFGKAVDLVPVVDGTLRWEWEPIFKIAVAVDQAATELGVPIRWGGVWDKLMSEYGGSPEAMKAEVAAYCVRHPGPDFLDGPHYELCKKVYP